MVVALQTTIVSTGYKCLGNQQLKKQQKLLQIQQENTLPASKDELQQTHSFYETQGSKSKHLQN